MVSPVLAGVGTIAVYVVCGFVSYWREGRALARRARELERAPRRTYGCGVAGTVVPLHARRVAAPAARCAPAEFSLGVSSTPAALLDGRDRFEAARARRDGSEPGGC